VRSRNRDAAFSGRGISSGDRSIALDLRVFPMQQSPALLQRARIGQGAGSRRGSGTHLVLFEGGNVTIANQSLCGGLHQRVGVGRDWNNRKFQQLLLVKIDATATVIAE
jgi:hypothetical protein